MPNSYANMRVDTLLTKVLAGHANQDFIAKSVLPAIFVPEETGIIGGLGMEHYRLDFPPRAMGGPTPKVDWQPSATITFAAKEWSLAFPIDDREVQRPQGPFDARLRAAWTIKQKLLLKLEKLVATMVMTSSNHGTTISGSAWSGAGDPIANIGAAISGIISKTGVSQSRLYGACSWSVWDWLRRNANVKNCYLNTVPGAALPDNIKPTQLAGALGLADLYVGSSVENTAKEGASDSMAFVWGTSTFAIFAKAQNPQVEEPGFGAIIVPEIPGLPGIDFAAEELYRDEDRRSDIQRVGSLYDMVGVTKNVGAIITGIS